MMVIVVAKALFLPVMCHACTSSIIASLAQSRHGGRRSNDMHISHHSAADEQSAAAAAAAAEAAAVVAAPWAACDRAGVRRRPVVVKVTTHAAG